VSNNKRLLSRREFIKTASDSTAALCVGGVMASSHLSGCDVIRTNSATEFDTLIKNGTLYDGTLREPYVADVGIKRDRITAVGKLEGSARTEINAEDYIVTPGFIDVHTHCDLTFKRTGAKRYLAYVIPSWKGNYNYIYQGVTTVITGNCGYGYSDANDWFDIVESVNFGTNVFHLAPHGAIRKEVFGREQPRELSAKQLDILKGRVAEEMEKGAIGLSTGLEYTPGWLSTSSELFELARLVRKYNGIYTTHVRDESGKTYPDERIGVLEAVKEAIEVGRRAEIPVEISHLKISSPTHTVSAEQLLDLLEQAQMEGLNVTADQYPYDASSTKLSFLLPNEFESSSGVKKRYKTGKGRLEIRKSIREVFTHLGPDKICITYYPEMDSYEGKTIMEIAEIEGKSPEECYTNMVCEDVSPDALFFSQDIKVVNKIMEKDYIITASDGWTIPKGMTKPHPRIYGTFPRKLKKFAFNNKSNDSGLEFVTVLRSMTGLPAEKFNLKGRGRIAKNYFADIAIINHSSITDRATYQAPHQYSEGITHLFVNGKLAIENGKATGTRNGRVLRRG
jgi:N-acyl-D-amino-acid deacylase